MLKDIFMSPIPLQGCSQGLGPNDNVRAATQRLAGIPRLSLSRSHYTDTDPTSRGPDCARLSDLRAMERAMCEKVNSGCLPSPTQGERLSHAVGCAFAICLEKKQKREKETGVSVSYNQSRTCFERTGSFRQTTLTERIVDPQSAILAEPVPVRSASNPYAVQRPHATANLLERQGSFRGFEKLQETSSPFKRTLSLRLNELPSTLQRQSAVLESPLQNGNGAVGGTIPEVPQEKEDSIAEMCQQLTQGLTALTGGDPFAEAPRSVPQLTHQASLPAAPFVNHAQTNQTALTRQHTSPASQTLQPVVPTSTNPWGSVPQPQPHQPQPQGQTGFVAHGWPTSQQASSNFSNPFSSSVSAHGPLLNGGQPTAAAAFPANTVALVSHGRSHSIDTGEMAGLRWQQLSTQPRQNAITAGQASTASSSASTSVTSNPWPTSAPPVPSSSAQGPGMDPFDVAWAAKSVNTASPNPFNNTKSVKQFEVQL
ncbi:protein numb [Elysia marginata]|uniref:Protein numb n=1 Tax=Elysia marginata TaxID=1093978 RepID=A0AAV4I602_9GAST|nr:protein numb [Elysia marginata]